MDPPSGEPRRKSTWAAIARIAAVVAIVGGGIWLWDAYKYDLFPKRFGVVDDGAVYRSGQLSPRVMQRTLESHNIQVIVDLTDVDPDDEGDVAEMEAAEALGIERIILPLEGDGRGDIGHYATAIAAIVEARDRGRPVLVHCHAGAHRTGGVIAAYRMLIEGMDPADAWDEMERYDWNGSKSPLPAYLNEHMPELADRLIEMQVLDEAPDPLPVLAPR